MKGRSPNQSPRINRVRLTRKKDDTPTAALNDYFFGSASSAPIPVFQVFGA